MNILNGEYGDYLTQEVYYEVCGVIAAVTGIICARIKKIGEEETTYTMSRIVEPKDLKAINDAIESGSIRVSDAVKKTFKQAAEDNDAYVAKYYRAKGVEQKAWVEAPYAKTILKDADSISKQTEKLIKNAKIDWNGRAVPISKVYREVVDEAVRAVAGGRAFDDVMLRTIDRLARTGLITVDYDTGFKMRIDGAVRRDVWNGVSDTFNAVRMKQGEEFGADGVELSAHATCAPDHAPYQGRQFSLEGNKVVKGVSYTSFDIVQASLSRPIGGVNCRHKAYPIILGVSRPSISETQLRRYEELSGEQIKWTGVSGKEMIGTRYDASQYKNDLERSIRTRRFQLLAQEQAGSSHAKHTEAKIRAMTQQYKGFCNSVQLTPNIVRTKIAA